MHDALHAIHTLRISPLLSGMIGSLHRLVAWTGTYGAILFLFANIKTTESGVGYVYLASVPACALFVLVARKDATRSLVLRRSSILLLGFLAYFVTKLVLDVHYNVARMKSLSLSTDGGLIFALSFGWILSALTTATFNEGARGVGRVIMPCLFLWACFGLSLDALATHLAEIRSDLFLVEGDSTLYQRPGNFAAMIAILASVQLVLATGSRAKQSAGVAVVVAATVVGYLGLIATLLVGVQLIGSNAGFVVTLFIGLASLAWVWRPDLSRLKRRMWSLLRPASLPMVLRRSIPRVALNGILFCLLASGLGFATLMYADIDFRSFRIFGFSDGSFGTHSLAGRIHILRDNFATQLAVNPVFGNLLADSLTIGTGSYAHSLLSMLSHMGLVGTSLFVAYLATLYRELKRPRAGSFPFYSDAEFAMFRVLMFAGLVVFALVGTFFTWMPLWFALGLLFPPCLLQRCPVMTDRKHSFREVLEGSQPHISGQT